MEEPGDVVVFLLHLPPVKPGAQDTPEAPARMEAEDRRRFGRMRSAQRRAEFAAGRLLLRHAMQICHPGLRWRLAAPEGEAPCVVAENPKLAPVVSIAHSAGVVACAVSAGRRLGVDIEHRTARKRDVATLAPAVLHPLEVAALGQLPAPRRHDVFLGIWTLKEALAKALGEGLSLPFREFAFEGLRLAAAPAAWSGMREQWAFAQPDAGLDAVLSLAWSKAGAAKAASVRLHQVTSQQLAEAVAR